MPEIVQFPITNLNDIPARLRDLADRIESGAEGKVETLFCIIPQPFDYPIIFGFGDDNGTSDPIVQLELAKHKLLHFIVVRQS